MIMVCQMTRNYQNRTVGDLFKRTRFSGDKVPSLAISDIW